MNILFLTLCDFNSIDESGIYTDLMREFVKNGHNIYMISPMEKRKQQPTKLIEKANHKILKVKIGNIQKTNIIEKGMSTLLIETQFLNAIIKYYYMIKFDLVLYSTPPITFERVIKYIKRRDNAKTYLLLKDIFPQNAVDLQMFSSRSVFYKYFNDKEKNLYKISDYIGCMSQANVDYLLNHNNWIDKSKVEVCPNSIEPVQIIKDAQTIVNIRKKYDIPLDKTVFVYGGNLGKPQGIDFLIECLKANVENEQAYFLIVGSGTEYWKLDQYVIYSRQKNLKLLSQLPKEDYEALVNSCDVGLIFLDRRFTIPNFPSRLLSYMQASMPVLAVTDVNTDVGQVIENGNFGFWCESNDIDEFNSKLQHLCNGELRKHMGERARRYLEDNYTANHSYEIIMKHF